MEKVFLYDCVFVMLNDFLYIFYTLGIIGDLKVECYDILNEEKFSK